MNTSEYKHGTLHFTNNYSLFRVNEINRDLTVNKSLQKSINKYGFAPSCAIHVKSLDDGTLLVIRGHHRLYEANRQGTGVWFIVDNTPFEIFEIESDSHQLWNTVDWCTARINEGNDNYRILKEFKEKHGLTMNVASSLVAGECAGSANKIKSLKRGTYKVGDMSHARDVVRITDLCADLGLIFARKQNFVAAVSACCMLEQFDIDMFCKKLRAHPKMMQSRITKDEYLLEIEQLYNYQLKGNAFPVSFEAKKESLKRKESFGKG